MQSLRKIGFYSAIFIFSNLIVAPEITASPGSGQFSLQQEKDRVYFIKGKDWLLILEKGQWVPGARENLTSRLPGGYLIRWPRQDTQYLLNNRHREAVIQKDGKPYGKIRLREVLEQWLEDDDLWGGHQAANQLRYMHQSAGGISGIITNAVPRGQSLIALLSWFAVGPSGMPIKAQHLVRVQAKPKPSMEPLRLLNDVSSGWTYGLSSDPVPRLFPFRGRLLLYTKPGETAGHAGDRLQPPSELLEITPDGKTLRVYAKIPSRRYPIGLLDGRWLILGEIGDKIDRPFWIYDLSLKKLSPLPGDWNGYYGSSYVRVPDKGQHILIHTISRDGKNVRTYLVTVPGGKRILLPGPADSTDYYLWQDMAILYCDGLVSVYDASAGKLMRKLKVPPYQPIQIPSPAGIPPVESIDLATDTPSIFPDETVRVVATPKDAKGNRVIVKIYDLQWKSSNPPVATVDMFGKVKGVGLGTTVISVTEVKSGKRASLEIQVKSRSPIRKGVSTAGTRAIQLLQLPPYNYSYNLLQAEGLTSAWYYGDPSTTLWW